MDHINSPSYLDDIAMTSTFCLILELAPSGSNLKMSFILPGWKYNTIDMEKFH